ncbi:MAG: HAMP domain-containing sensor histidine kinase [Chloroflexota bacterium]
MSIQKKLLIIYTTIFTTAFAIFALIVYVLPEKQLQARIDSDLEAVAAEVLRPDSSFMIGPDGVLRSVGIPPELDNLGTATTFIVFVDARGHVVTRSSSAVRFNQVLDSNLPFREKQISFVHHEQSLLRVLTIPVYDYNRGNRLAGYLQVGRLLDTLEDYNNSLFTALMFSGLAAAVSVLFAVLLTPAMFRPLEDIARTARQITRADDLSRRVPHAHRPDEVGEMARAFNQTLERLERLFQTQQRLLADVSHELRTPLTAIRGNIDLMQHFGEADPDSLTAMQDDIERMSRLVGDLLLLARADSGAIPLELKPVELDNVLFDVYRQVERLAELVDVKLSVVDQVTVWGDVDRLKQLVLNLVDNSLKYTPAGGEVIISLEKNSNWALITVSDTGIGISTEHLPHIFERFYRADKARSRMQGGSGLGLSIARWIVQAHKGDIRVESKPGKGTSFTISLPIYNKSSQPSDEKTTEAQAAPARASYSSALRLLGGSGRQK